MLPNYKLKHTFTIANAATIAVDEGEIAYIVITGNGAQCLVNPLHDPLMAVVTCRSTAAGEPFLLGIGEWHLTIVGPAGFAQAFLFQLPT